MYEILFWLKQTVQNEQEFSLMGAISMMHDSANDYLSTPRIRLVNPGINPMAPV